MTKLRVFLGAVLAVYLFEAVWAMNAVGFSNTFAAMFENPISRLMVLELGIAFTMVGFGIWRDARERGLNAVPYLALTVLAGPVGPLLYLIRRDAPQHTTTEPVRQPA